MLSEQKWLQHRELLGWKDSSRGQSGTEEDASAQENLYPVCVLRQGSDREVLRASGACFGLQDKSSLGTETQTSLTCFSTAVHQRQCALWGGQNTAFSPPVHNRDTEIPAAPANGNLDHLTPCEGQK